MIQRIQTVYVIIALLIIGSLFFSNLGTLTTTDALYLFKYNGFIEYGSENSAVVFSTFALQALLFVTAIVLFIVIFLYKKRLLQVRIAGFSIGLLLGISVLIFYFGKAGAKELDAVFNFNWTLVAPIIAIILMILAMISITKDEALVKSLDRLR